MDTREYLEENTHMMYISELKGKHVISLTEALKMGMVQDALLDPTGRYVAAIRVHSSAGRDQVVRRQAVKHVGLHAIVLSMSDDLIDSAREDPELDRLIDLRTLVGLEVISDQGNLIGRIQDALIDPETLNIEEYELTRNFWDRYLQTGPRIAAATILSCSKDLLIVPERTLTSIGPERAAKKSRGETKGMPSAPNSQLQPADNPAMTMPENQDRQMEDTPTIPGQMFTAAGNPTERTPQNGHRQPEGAPRQVQPSFDVSTPAAPQIPTQPDEIQPTERMTKLPDADDE
jgi:uncharacterized protein YrrD